MHILVIGASGFLGNVLCRLLSKKGYSITAVDLNATSAKSLSDLKINKLDLNILDIKKSEKVLCDHDVVIHLASLIRITKDKDRSMYNTNVVGLKNIANLALRVGVKKFIFLSSIHAFHRFPSHEAINENRQLAISNNEFDYDKSKAFGELVLLDAVKQGLDATIISPTCFIGPYDYCPSLMGAAIYNFFHSKIIYYLKGGFNFIDVRDVAESIITSITKGVAGERYILAGEWLSISQMIDIIISVRKYSATKIKIPNLLAQITAQMNLLKWKLINKYPTYSNQSLSHLSFHRFIDDTKAREVLNHNPRPLYRTFIDIFNWYYKNNDEFI